jgi:hypothetical protein
MPMTDARRPRPPLDDRLDAALARTVQRAAPADLRARVLAGVVRERPEWRRPVAVWTAVAAAVAVAVIVPRATRTPPATPRATATPISAVPAVRSPEPAAESPAAVLHLAARERPRPAVAIARIPRVRRSPEDRTSLADADELVPLSIDPLEDSAAPIAPLHTDDLVIAPLAIEEADSLASEDTP